MADTIEKPVEEAKEAPVNVRNLHIQVINGATVKIVESEMTALELRSVAEVLHNFASNLINGK